MRTPRSPTPRDFAPDRPRTEDAMGYITSMYEELTIEGSPLFEERPWGRFWVLDEGPGFKVKRIEVLPGTRLSYQRHAQRSEHWIVVQGPLTVTLDGERNTFRTGDSVDIDLGVA